jgi:hypothetical protein
MLRRVTSGIEHPPVIAKILIHLGLRFEKSLADPADQREAKANSY